MNKFTLFTIVLAACVVTVTADLVVRDYVATNGKAGILDAFRNSGGETKEPTSPPPPVTTPPPPTTTPPPAPLPTLEPPPPAEVPTSLVGSAMLKNAGFEGKITEQHFDGKVYQLLDISKIPVELITSYEVGEVVDAATQETTPIALVTEIILKDEIRALQMYVLLQNKTKAYIDLSLNETNAYGDRSFYINHGKKPDEAFLTIKLGNRIYAIAYVKLYHTQVKKLIELLAA